MNLHQWKAAVFALCLLPAAALLAADSETGKNNYDQKLAAELGADDYGMRRYVFALLKAGPKRDQDKETAAELQRAHMANIQRLAEEGKLVLAGPFLDGGELRGIYIFDVANVEEARKLTETDPAIQAGRLVMELHPWYGSAAIGKLNEFHGRIAKKIRDGHEITGRVMRSAFSAEAISTRISARFFDTLFLIEPGTHFISPGERKTCTST